MKCNVEFDCLMFNENQRATRKICTESQRLVLRLSTVTYNYDTVVLVCFEEKYQYLWGSNNLYRRRFI